MRGPQVEPGLGVRDQPACLLKCGAKDFPAPRVPGVLLVCVVVIAQRHGHRRLDWRRHDHAGVLAYLEQRGHQAGVARHEPGPVPGEVRPLGQRIDGEQPVVRGAAHIRMQHRHGDRVESEVDVALIGCQDCPGRPRPADKLAHPRGRKHPPGRVGRRVEPGQPDWLGAGCFRIVGGHGLRPCEPRPDVVGRVGKLRKADGVAGSAAEQRREPGDEFLGADYRQHGVRVGSDPVPAREPAGSRGTQRRRSPGQRVAGRVRCRRERCLDYGGNGVDRSADRQVSDAVRVRGGDRRRGCQPVPWKFRQPRCQRRLHPAGLLISDRHGQIATGQCSAACGGSAATSGWSLPIFPVLEAPPGEPRSSKNSTLTL